MPGSGEISQIYRSGPASARKDPSSIPNVSEAIASLNSTPEANSPREKRRCFFAPRLRRGQSSEPPFLTLDEVTPCFLLIGDLGLMTAVLCGAKERERERLVASGMSLEKKTLEGGLFWYVDGRTKMLASDAGFTRRIHQLGIKGNV
ncbi:hypothetical protein LR48_Vigan06g078300 [Vigna angularis]|uniref:Uncharacterized protein n=1 Tax=Phaseolus angularis TaxID=3914 RepID=A0A0L9USD4_PHAAN|nr:hypothetical protein LR48_Vigan06g078300 [Vigna angularis]